MNSRAGAKGHAVSRKELVCESFRLRFQERFREYLARHGLVPHGFDAVWEDTTREFHLDKASQAPLFWELTNWAQSYERFTGTEHRPSERTTSAHPR